MLTERELIAFIAKGHAGARPVRGDIGIGDDCAVLRVGRSRLLVTTDLVTEGIHFDLAYAPPYFIGRKAVAAALSDIAAMGGAPRGVFVSVAVPAARGGRFALALAEGIHDEAIAAGVPVLGGDTSASAGPVFLDVTVLGEASARGPVMRSGARPGDVLYVSGALGASALGLRLMRKGLRPWSWKAWSRLLAKSEEKRARARAPLLAALAHLHPHPRLALGGILSRRRIATAMIDISDGLSTDLHNLCDASRVGARIEESSLPLHEALSIEPRHALRLALGGGEDYELLFTTRPARKDAVARAAREAGISLTPIGRITASRGKVLLVGRDGRAQPLPRGGYEHFR